MTDKQYDEIVTSWLDGNITKEEMLEKIRKVRKEAEHKAYEQWPYKDMNGFCLDIGDTVKLVGYDKSWDRFKIIGFTLTGKTLYTNTGHTIPTNKVLWVS